VAKTYEFDFNASPDQVFTETVSAVTALGFAVLDTDRPTTSIRFNTGASIWSTAGQDMIATTVALSPSSSRLVVDGQTARRGDEAQYGSWGERSRIAKGLAVKIRGAIGSSKPVESPANGSTSNGTAFVAELATLAELHRTGALTDHEFAEAKQRLLSA
jgi:hypothetical protein